MEIETHRLIKGRRWRVSDPGLGAGIRQQLVGELMRARRDVGSAKRANDDRALRRARFRVHDAKVALGERGARWWDLENETPERIEDRRVRTARALARAEEHREGEGG